MTRTCLCEFWNFEVGIVEDLAGNVIAFATHFRLIIFWSSRDSALEFGQKNHMVYEALNRDLDLCF